MDAAQMPAMRWPSLRPAHCTGGTVIHLCLQCGGRVCAQPIVLAVLSFIYVWDVMLFGYLAYLDSLWYLAVMTAAWLILDYFTIYVPLTPLRTQPETSKPTSTKDHE